MTVSRGAIAHLLVRAGCIGVAGALAFVLLVLLFDVPPGTSLPVAALTGTYVGVCAPAPLVVERVARRWPASWRRDLAAALLAVVAGVAWGVPTMVQGAHARATVEGASFEGAQAKAVREAERLLSRPLLNLAVVASCCAVFLPATLVALRRGPLWRDVLLCAPPSLALTAGLLWLVGAWQVWPHDCVVFTTLVAAAGLVSPLAHRLADRVEGKVAGA